MADLTWDDSEPGGFTVAYLPVRHEGHEGALPWLGIWIGEVWPDDGWVAAFRWPVASPARWIYASFARREEAQTWVEGLWDLQKGEHPERSDAPPERVWRGTWPLWVKVRYGYDW